MVGSIGKHDQFKSFHFRKLMFVESDRFLIWNGALHSFIFSSSTAKLYHSASSAFMCLEASGRKCKYSNTKMSIKHWSETIDQKTIDQWRVISGKLALNFEQQRTQFTHLSQKPLFISLELWAVTKHERLQGNLALAIIEGAWNQWLASCCCLGAPEIFLPVGLCQWHVGGNVR